MGFFEHSGTVTGNTMLPLVFSTGVVNDVLKSLMINDPGSTEYSVLYPTEQTLERRLQSLKVDLSGNPSITRILTGLKGAEVDVYAPNLINGRIVSVEGDYPIRPLRVGESANTSSAAVSLFTKDGIKVVQLADVVSFVFKDRAVNEDMTRALNLIMESHGSNSRTLTVQLPGTSTRDIALSYVLPTAVWKVSYRLDLSGDRPFLQGWAIIDNDSDTDWKNVELSLVTGGPDSFIQNLYKPYHVSRRTVPLSIEGIEAANRATVLFAGERPMSAPVPAAAALAESDSAAMKTAVAAGSRANAAGEPLVTPRGQDAAEQFEYTFTQPISIARQQSVMIPLVESIVEATKTLLFSGTGPNQQSNPAIAVEVVNTTGSKLPAGAVTVYDGGTYAGDALMTKFFPNRDRQYLSYGKDLSVTGGMQQGSPTFKATVEISNGVMIVTRVTDYKTTYTFRNNGTDQKTLVVEHPISEGRRLRNSSVNEVEDPSYWQNWRYWRSDIAHYFTLQLPVGRESTIIIDESRDDPRRIFLNNQTLNSLRDHANNGEFSQNARNTLKTALDALQKVEDAKNLLKQQQQQQQQVRDNQTNIRANLQVVGHDSEAGRTYTEQLQADDVRLIALTAQISDTEAAIKAAQDAYTMVITTLTFKD
jgi:hypothetical protein